LALVLLACAFFATLVWRALDLVLLAIDPTLSHDGLSDGTICDSPASNALGCCRLVIDNRRFRF
jgi:hypothetical protein